MLNEAKMRTILLVFVLACPVYSQGFSLVSETVPTAAEAEVTQSTIDLVQSAQSYDTGDLIVLDAKGASPSAIATTYKWIVIPDTNYLVWPDGSKLVMSTGKMEEFRIIMTVGQVFKEGDVVSQSLETITRVIKINGNTTTIVPVPTDNSINSWLNSIKISTEYTRLQAKNDAKKLSASFRDIAAKIDAGQYNSINSILTATKDNNDSLMIEKEAWSPWFDQLASYLKQLTDNNKLETMQQYSTLWKSIANTLEIFSLQ